MKKTVPTIRDVAAAAQVSIATVSKYVNGAQRFSPAVESALDAAIAALGYTANPLAKSMITGRSDAVGLVLPDLDDPRAGGILRGAGRVAGEHGLALLLGATRGALAARVDGMLLLAGAGADEQEVPGAGKPVVLVGGPASSPLPGVAGDERAGAAMLARHLCMLGHRRIAYLGLPTLAADGARIDGMRAVLAQAGLALTVIDADGDAAAEGARLCAGIVLGERRPDALVCRHDLVALAFMQEATRLGLRLPREMSVAGFGNVAGGQYATPALTTLDPLDERIGALAMDKLLAMLRGAAVEQHTLVTPQPVLRASTAARSG